MFNLRTQKAQALLELSIFGAILIMLLGILANYGLRYYNQQKVAQEAFRKAMASAAVSLAATSGGVPLSNSYVVVKDQQIPNPSDPFGVGSVMPVSSGGSVTRSYTMLETATTQAELPETVFEIEGKESSVIVPFKTAGFREESNISEDLIDKYLEIYGHTVEYCGEFDVNGLCVKWVSRDSKDAKKTCNEEPVIDPDTGEADPDWECSDYIVDRIRFIDSCAGAIIDYSTMISQCRRIRNEGNACTRECIISGGAEDSCSATCSKAINVPAYCNNIEEIFTTKFTPDKERDKERGFGLQDDYTQATSINNNLVKNETQTGITTTDTLDWQVDTSRSIVYYSAYDASDPSAGIDCRAVNSLSNAFVCQRQITTSVGEKDKTKTWQASW